MMGIHIGNFPVTSPQGVRTWQSENTALLVYRGTASFCILDMEVESQEILPLWSFGEGLRLPGSC